MNSKSQSAVTWHCSDNNGVNFSPFSVKTGGALGVFKDCGNQETFCDTIGSSSVTQCCPTLCDSMDYSMPGFPVHH